ncbi:MAG: hypothetical protein WC011_01795 [Candidatus Paceibacterota bacterium]
MKNFDLFLFLQIMPYICLWISFFILIFSSKQNYIFLANMSWLGFFSGLVNHAGSLSLSGAKISFLVLILIYFCYFVYSFYLHLKGKINNDKNLFWSFISICLISITQVIFIKNYYNSWQGFWFLFVVAILIIMLIIILGPNFFREGNT